MFEINKKTLRNVFLVVAAGIVFYWLLHDTERVSIVFGVVKGIFSPFVLGAGLAFILNVPTRSFEGLYKKVKNDKLRRLLAVISTFLALLLVLALVFWLLIPQLAETVKTLIPALQTFFTNAQVYVTDFLNENPKVMQWLVDYTNFESFDFAGLFEKMLSVVSASLSTILGGAFSAIGIVFGGVVDFVIALVFSIYALFQKETLARQGRKLIYAFLPERFCDNVVRILRLTNSTFSNFLSGQCIEVCILGGMFAICMAIFKMPYIPLISILIAVTAFIPIVGAFIGCIVGAFLIFVNDPLQAVFFVAMFLVIQQIEGNLIYPKVVGTSIGLNGMWVLLAVAVGGELFGIAGMFLMIPFASVIYTLLREVSNKRLGKLTIDPEKLKDQPPELRSHFKEQRKKIKAKREKRRFERKAKKESK